MIDPADERVSRVYLTDAGREIQHDVQRLWQAFETQALAGFSEQEVGFFQGFLTRLHDNMLEIDYEGLLAGVNL